MLAPFALWGLWIEPTRLVVRAVEVPVRVPAAFAGVRVALLSDLHVGGFHITEARLRTIVARTNAEKPDAIFLAGDYVTTSFGRFVAPEDFAPILGELRAPAGVYAVLGNHDWWWNGRRTRKALESAGIRVLENEAAPVTVRGQTFWLAGVPDEMTQDPEPADALRGVPAEAPVVVLTHSPDVFPRVPGRVALTLAGHTHGGQVRLPLFGAPVVPSRYGQRYAQGLVVEDGHALFVTTGIGTSILPLRFGVTPEIAILTLRPR